MSECIPREKITKFVFHARNRDRNDAKKAGSDKQCGETDKKDAKVLTTCKPRPELLDRRKEAASYSRRHKGDGQQDQNKHAC